MQEAFARGSTFPLLMQTRPRRLPLVAALAMLAAAALTGPAWGVTADGERKRPNGVLAPQPAPAPAPTAGTRAARIALGVVGVPYRYGGESPASGFDCSGLVRWAYRRLGIDLPHSSYALASEGRGVGRGAMRPGDVLLFDGLGHVGLYIGGGRMVHAPQSGRDVETVALGSSAYGQRLVGARRIVRA